MTNPKGTDGKKILIITYVFPPTGYVGTHRTLKYCRYLGQHGWTPVVLTAKPIGVRFLDERLLGQIPPEVVVHRTFDIDPAKWEDTLAKRKYRSTQNRGAHAPAETAPIVTQSATGTPGVLERLKRWIKRVLTESPDSHVFWVPFAVVRGLSILLWQRIDIVYSTSPPHSVHLAAFFLARCFRKPYVLDFREPWYVDGSLRISESRVRAVSKLETWAKRVIVRRAACVICMSKGERDDLRAEFPQKDPQAVIYIPNGFDPTDFPEAGMPAEALPGLSLIHTGTIYDGIAGEFFGALQRLVAADPETARSMQVHLVGEISYKYSDVVDKLSSAGIVRVHGFQPYEKTLQLVQRSDVPVMLMGGSKWLASHLPSKLFEYLYVGKPIFAIAREGEVTDILRRSGLGIVVQPHSVDSVVTALRNIVADHAAGRLGRAPNKAYIRTFERVALTEKLAGALDAVREAALVRKQSASR